uniref:Vomeronasal type-1 receptor n=1 Tax=Sarcophilus harrisii TaxID=9305 RepID=A0A7N4NL87_SARHA
MFGDLALGIIFLIQMGVGILGNFFLLGLYSFTLFIGQRLRPIDCIFAHLTLANSEVLLSKGIPHTIACLGIKNFLDRIGCRITVCIQNVARSVSLSITCLLSGFQVITISPSNSKWAELKPQAQKCVVHSCFLCWCFYLLINFTLLGTISNNTRVWNIGFCSQFSSSSLKVSRFLILSSIPDFLCVGFMVIASNYLVLLLQRHHQQVQYIHSSSHLSRRSPEIKATYTILVLVSTYVSFYSANSVLSFYLFIFDKYYVWLMPTSAFLAACFPAISPFVLLSSDSHILQLFYSLWKKKRSQHSPFPGCSLD